MQTSTLLIVIFAVPFASGADCNRFQLPPVDFTLADAVRTDVLYHLFTRENPEGIYLTEDTIITFNITRNIPTKIVIHGWLSNETTYWYAPIRDAYFSTGEHNIIYIDWSSAGSKTYEVSAANTKPIGEFIGDFIIAGDFDLEEVHVIGHSLGSHVAAFIGKQVFSRTGQKLDRITGTDPAGPGFESPDLPSSLRLTYTDADFVDVVHTDVGYYGFGAAIGQIDFYANGGSNQPGCPPLEVDDNCSHARSNYYFIESITSDAFVATECHSWEGYLAGDCQFSNTTIFGENVPKGIEGVYYFATNSESPFAMG